MLDVIRQEIKYRRKHKTPKNQIKFMRIQLKLQLSSFFPFRKKGVPPSVSKRISLSIHCKYKHLLIFNVWLRKCFKNKIKTKKKKNEKTMGKKYNPEIQSKSKRERVKEH